MATHSSTLAWKIPWMEGPGGLHAVHGVARSRTWMSDFTFTFHFPALEKEMATHSSLLAWRIPGTGGPGGLPSMGLRRVGHDWSDLAAAAVFSINTVAKNPPASAGDARDSALTPGSGRSLGVGNGNPLQYSWLGNSMERGAWRATGHGVAKSWTPLCTHTHTCKIHFIHTFGK